VLNRISVLVLAIMIFFELPLDSALARVIIIKNNPNVRVVNKQLGRVIYNNNLQKKVNTNLNTRFDKKFSYSLEKAEGVNKKSGTATNCPNFITKANGITYCVKF
jgi:hypothetical protein